MNTVCALVLRKYGGPEALQLALIAPPVAGSGQVLGRVHAAGINGLDWKLRDGLVQKAFPLQLPQVLGIELAGVVEAVGAGVSRLRSTVSTVVRLDELPAAIERHRTHARLGKAVVTLIDA